MAVGKKIAHGVAWMMLFRGAERVLGLISTLLLVRLLLPGDFGIVAMATSIIAAVEVLGAFSFDTVLIHRQDATREHYDTVRRVRKLSPASPVAANYHDVMDRSERSLTRLRAIAPQSSVVRLRPGIILPWPRPHWLTIDSQCWMGGRG